MVARRRLVPADFERMNLPEELWTTKIQGVPESVRSTVENYLVRIDEMVDNGAGLLLFGPKGVGKTSIAALIAKEARAAGKTVYFTTLWELRESVRARFMFDETLSILDRCREVDVLVLDGFKEEDADPKEYHFGMRSIEELLSTRGVWKKVTVLTTALREEDIGRKTPRLAEAIQGHLVPIEVKGPNQALERQKKLAEVVQPGGRSGSR